MRSVMGNLDFIEHPRATEIIIELSKFNKEVSLGELTGRLQCSISTVYDRINELLKAGIIIDRYEKVRTMGSKRIVNKRFLKFTQKGKIVGEILRELDCRLS